VNCNTTHYRATSDSGSGSQGYGRPVFRPLVVGNIGQSLLAG